MAGDKKKPKPKDPRIYAYALEYGFGNIPPRPLFGNTLEEYTPTFKEKVKSCRSIILTAWR
ncbi:MAG: hypothetical protein WC346_17165 [Methanogenium sp.]|jgi:hypothetical protein